MNDTNSLTLVNSQNGILAFKIFGFECTCLFNQVQRLGYYSLILMNAGNGKLKVDFSEYDFTGNMLMCFSPYQPFMLESTAPVKGLCIHFHPDFFCIYKHQEETACNGVLFNNVYDPPLVYTQLSQTEKLVSIADSMRTEICNPGPDQYDLLISYLKIFLINASRIKVGQNLRGVAEFSGKHQPMILRDLKDAIETHFKTKHTPSDYAKLLHISPKALAKICRNHFQKNLTDLIAERIVIEAKRELYLTNKPVKKIAWELGYNDEYYFSRFFKRNAEISPQFYRDSIGHARAEGFAIAEGFSRVTAS